MTESYIPSRAEPQLPVKAGHAPFVDFAMQQTAVPSLRSVRLTNVSDRHAINVIVRVWGVPHRACMKAAVICFALACRKTRYIDPDAGLEEAGRKIRTPGNLLAGKRETRMDAMASLAACFGQGGRRTVLALVSER